MCMCMCAFAAYVNFHGEGWGEREIQSPHLRVTG